MQHTIINDYEWVKISKKLLDKNANIIREKNSSDYYIESDGFYNKNKLFKKYNKKIVEEKHKIISKIKKIYAQIEENVKNNNYISIDNILNNELIDTLRKCQYSSQNNTISIDILFIFPQGGFTKCENLVRFDDIKIKNKGNDTIMQIGGSTYSVNSMSYKEKNKLLCQLNKNLNLLDFGHNLLNVYIKK